MIWVKVHVDGHLNCHVVGVDAHFWQKDLMAEKTQQYEKLEKENSKSKDHWARMAGVMVHKPTK